MPANSRSRYAQLLAALYNTSVEEDQFVSRICSIVGAFNLNQSRVLDIVLEAFEMNLSENRYYFALLDRFDRGSIPLLLVNRINHYMVYLWNWVYWWIGTQADHPQVLLYAAHYSCGEWIHQVRRLLFLVPIHRRNDSLRCWTIGIWCLMDVHFFRIISIWRPLRSSSAFTWVITWWGPPLLPREIHSLSSSMLLLPWDISV